jgi:hypothetical protein
MKELKNFEISIDVIEECLKECLDNCNSKKKKEKKTPISSR